MPPYTTALPTLHSHTLYLPFSACRSALLPGNICGWVRLPTCHWRSRGCWPFWHAGAHSRTYRCATLCMWHVDCVCVHISMTTYVTVCVHAGVTVTVCASSCVHVCVCLLCAHVHAWSTPPMCMQGPPLPCACRVHPSHVHAGSSPLMCMQGPPLSCACRVHPSHVHAGSTPPMCMQGPPLLPSVAPKPSPPSHTQGT